MPTTYQQPKTKPLASKPITPLNRPRMSSESPRGSIGDLFGWIDNAGRAVEQGVNSVILPSSRPPALRQPTLAGRPAPSGPALSTPYAQQPQLGLATPSAPPVNPVQTQEVQEPRDLPQAGQQAPVQMAQPAYGPRATELGNLKIALNSVFDRPGRDAEYRYQPGDNPVGAYVGGLRHAATHTYADGAAQGGLFNNYGAGIGYSNTGYMPNKTVGGAYGQPVANLPGTPGYESAVTRDQEIASRGGQREAILAEMNNRPTGYKPPPLYDFGVQTNGGDGTAKLLATGRYEIGPSGSIQPKGYGDSSYLPSTAVANAIKMQSSPERSAYLEGRKNAKAERMANVQANRKIVGDQRRERIANRKYVPSFEDRLAAANPGAYQGRRAMEAKMNGEIASRDLQLGLARDQMASRERMNTERMQSAEAIAEGRLNAENGPAPAQPPPIKSAPLPDASTRLIRGAAATGDEQAIRDELVRNGVVDKAEQDRVLKEVTGNPNAGLGFFQRAAPIFSAPFYRR